MISKVINYIWLSDERPGELIKKCMESWQKSAPDYEIKRWKMSDFDWTVMPAFVREAVKEKKWAFACDYLRLFILYHYGGIYLDSDVFMLKSPDEYINCRFFTSVEYYPEICPNISEWVDSEFVPINEFVSGFGFQAAVMGSEPGHPFVKSCMEFYESRHFIKEDGSYFTDALASGIQGSIAVKYGFRYKDELQHCKENMVVYPSYTFAGGIGQITEESAMLHVCSGGWRDIPMLNRYKNNITKIHEIKKITQSENRRS